MPMSVPERGRMLAARTPSGLVVAVARAPLPDAAATACAGGLELAGRGGTLEAADGVLVTADGAPDTRGGALGAFGGVLEFGRGGPLDVAGRGGALAGRGGSLGGFVAAGSGG
jgi:hypothetical protein